MSFWQQPNTVVLGGRITNDLTLRDVKDTKALDFSIANNLSIGGESKTKTGHFFRCEAWGKTAENIQKHFAKGDPILVTGSLQWSSWQDKTTGNKREETKVRVDSFFFPESSSRKEENNSYSAPPPPLKSPPVLYPVRTEEDDKIKF